MNDIIENIKTKGMQKFIALGALIVLYVAFSVFGNNFFTVDTLVSIFDASYYIGFLAIGVTFVIITGGIDLSIGTVMMCSAIVGGTLYNNMGVPLWLSPCGRNFRIVKRDYGFPPEITAVYRYFGYYDGGVRDWFHCIKCAIDNLPHAFCR